MLSEKSQQSTVKSTCGSIVSLLERLQAVASENVWCLVSWTVGEASGFISGHVSARIVGGLVAHRAASSLLAWRRSKFCPFSTIEYLVLSVHHEGPVTSYVCKCKDRKQNTCERLRRIPEDVERKFKRKRNGEECLGCLYFFSLEETTQHTQSWDVLSNDKYGTL